MKITKYISQTLYEHGVKTIFGHLGGFNADFIDQIYAHPKQQFILNYHEQASAFAANSYAMMNNTIGVATSSGAPSFCNMVAGIANAYFDSNPCVFIAGSINSKALRTTKKLRQNAFEEIDMLSLVDDITKYAVHINDENDVRYYLEKAIYIANSGRKGPVLIDLPYDIARKDIDPSKLKGYTPPETNYDEFDITKIVKSIKSAKRPLILLGGGAKSLSSKKSLKELLARVKIPAVSSLCGLDALPHDHECFYGFIGHYGNRYANFAIANCDCLIVLGSRLDERQIAGDKKRFAGDAKIIRIDIDEFEFGSNIKENISLYTTAELFLNRLSKCDFEGYNCSSWIDIISKWKKRYPYYNLESQEQEVDINNFLYILSGFLTKDAIICSDVGQSQMSVAQAMPIDNEKSLINCGGYGSMGFSLPASIGAQYAKPDTMVVYINGDGGIQMNMQELQTIARDKLPIKIFIFNNNCLGMIRRLQERIFDNRTSASVEGYYVQNYEAIANAYNIKYLKISSKNEYNLVKDFIDDNEACIVEVIIPQEMQNNPEPGASIDKQTPLLTDEENEEIKSECL